MKVIFCLKYLIRMRRDIFWSIMRIMPPREIVSMKEMIIKGFRMLGKNLMVEKR